MFSKRTKILASAGVLSIALSFGWLFLWKRGVDIGNEQLRKSPSVVKQDGSVEWDAPVWAEPPGGVTVLFRGGVLILVLGCLSFVFDADKKRRQRARLKSPEQEH
jgi:hypothetical protein